MPSVTDVRWLGADWEDREFYASDYFGQLYEWAEKLIQDGKAYVCDLTRRRRRQVSWRTQRRKGKPVSQPHRGGEPRPVPAHDGG